MVRVTLRSSVRVPSAAAVTIGDVATIEGETTRRADVLIAPSDERRAAGDARIEVTARDVLEALGLPRARVVVRGTVCRVRFMDPAPPPVLKINEQGRLVETFDGPILRDHIRARVAAELGVADEDLRLDFAEGDARLIRTPTTGLTVEIQPLGLSADMPIAATLYDGETIVLSQTLRVDVQVRKAVLVADRPIERRSTIAGSDYSSERRWIDPTVTPATVADMDHATARAALAPGETIEARHVEPPIVVERGDIVSVRCVAGSIVAKVAARALEDARDGDRIRFEPVNGGRRFQATVNGPGRAVLARPSAKEESR
jgi:flagella basal body P-ring formation protein FlgA